MRAHPSHDRLPTLAGAITVFALAVFLVVAAGATVLATGAARFAQTAESRTAAARATGLRTAFLRDVDESWRGLAAMARVVAPSDGPTAAAQLAAFVKTSDAVSWAGLAGNDRLVVASSDGRGDDPSETAWPTHSVSSLGTDGEAIGVPGARVDLGRAEVRIAEIAGVLRADATLVSRAVAGVALAIVVVLIAVFVKAYARPFARSATAVAHGAKADPLEAPRTPDLTDMSAALGPTRATLVLPPASVRRSAGAGRRNGLVRPTARRRTPLAPTARRTLAA